MACLRPFRALAIEPILPVGAGIEYAFTSNIIGPVEYRYTHWGTYTNNLNIFLAPPETSLDRVTENQVTVGISYKLGGPTAAKN